MIIIFQRTVSKNKKEEYENNTQKDQNETLNDKSFEKDKNENLFKNKTETFEDNSDDYETIWEYSKSGDEYSSIELPRNADDQHNIDDILPFTERMPQGKFVCLFAWVCGFWLT